MFSAAQRCSRAFSRCLSTNILLSPSQNITRHYATETETAGKTISESLSRATEIFKTYKPVTPGLRHLRRPINNHLWEGKPLRALTVPLRKKGGRNADGRITVRFRGGGHRQRIRLIDFMRKDTGPHDVVRIEYDPIRSGHIALIRGRDPTANKGMRWNYILAPEGLRSGDVVESFRDGIPTNLVPGFVDPKTGPSIYLSGSQTSQNDAYASEEVQKLAVQAAEAKSAAALALGLLRARTLKPGNVLPLRLIPTGTMIHSIGLKPEGEGVLVRSAGSYGQITSHDEKGRYTQVRLQSGEIRKIHQNCCASIGRVSNIQWRNRSLGKAGRSRWLGRRPHVRGMAMNRVDHPHGGGRGKSKGNKQPRSPWGWLTKGKRTRKPGPKGPKNSNKMVIRERPRGKEKRRL